MAHRRNYGLSHIVPRASSRANSPGLRARLLYTCERLLQCAPYSLGKTHRPTGQQIAVDVIYMGRVIFHVGETRMVPQESLTRVRGEI